ncbi:piggyBac transposable element-derived protein 3-like [Scomber scombrus]|uniref:PiggyBac transposable element-derived protein 3-like n=1 Tax=Scomber scombrus TaxID=13677 RepID=A0AAV1Q286_SCOSC
MASDFVGVGRMDEVQRWVKKKAQFLMVSHPEVVKLYNEAMGGVDLLDQLVSLYHTEIRSKKWTLRMITHAFDVAVVNSCLEYRLDAKRANIQTKDIQDLLNFKMNVAQCLVRVHKTVAAKRGRPSMSPEPQRVPQRPAHRPVQDVRVYLKCSMTWLTTCQIMMKRKRLLDARCHTVQERHTSFVTSATSTCALCHTETASRLLIENENT